MKDISTMYTKYLNNECGRKGYYAYKIENATTSPKEYGEFLKRKRRSRRKRVL